MAEYQGNLTRDLLYMPVDLICYTLQSLSQSVMQRDKTELDHEGRLQNC